MDNAFEWFQAGQAPLTPEEEDAIARRPPPPDILTAPPAVPNFSGTASQALRRSAPRFTRPGSVTQALGSKPVPKPLAKPVNIAAAAAPRHLQHRKHCRSGSQLEYLPPSPSERSFTSARSTHSG